MNFTKETPKLVGFYAWKVRKRSDVQAIILIGDDERPSPSRIRISNAPTNGLWSRLVPVEELEQAFHEGVNAQGRYDDGSGPPPNYLHSEACRVSKGLHKEQT